MKCGPLVIVGQARSGSTLLTRLLADTGHFLLVNDAYFLQMADDISRGALCDRQARHLAAAVVERMQERAITGDIHTVNRSVPLNDDQFQSLKAQLPQIVPQGAPPEKVIAAVLEKAAQMAGSAVCGWNSPQDYVHAERLLKAFPEARILFLIRNPFDVLKSYKNLPAYWGRERNRYHPAVQSLVWRTVVREFLRLQALYPGHIRLLRYEDMVAADADTWAGFADFLGVFPTPQPASSYDRNSSKSPNSSKGQDARGRNLKLSQLEISICRAVAGPYLRRLGYADAVPAAERVGLGDLAAASARFIGYYAQRAATSRDMRQRIRRFAAALRGRAAEKSAMRPGAQ